MDNKFKAFSDEIAGLAHILNLISVSFEDPDIASLTVLTGHEGQHWRDVRRSLDDCQFSLDTLAKILEGMGADEKGVLGRIKKQLKLNMKSKEIEFLRRQTLCFTQAMQISLQMINL